MSFRSSGAVFLFRFWPALTLAAGALRTPALRLLASGAAPAGPSAAWALYPLLGFASFVGTALDAVAGPTQLATTPAQPIEVRVGKPVEIRFRLINTVTDAKSYRVSGKVPPGLAYADLDKDLINEPEGILKGTPTKPGTYTLGIVGCEDYNGFGRRKRESLVIKVVR